MTVYSFDFFENLVSINFPSGGYALLKLTASNTVTGGSFAPAPRAAFTLGENEKMVFRSEPTRNIFTPAHTTFQKIYFVWTSIASFPTVDNYNNVVSLSPFSITYLDQFALVADFGAGFSSPALPDGLHDHETGTFASLADAQAYADAYNAYWAPRIVNQEWFGPDGSAQGPAAFAGMFGAELDIPTNVPATSQTILSGTYLLRIPKANTIARLAVTGDSGDLPFLTGKAYSKQGTVTNPSQLKEPPDSSSLAFNSSGLFDIRTAVPKLAQIRIVGGGTGGG